MAVLLNLSDFLDSLDWSEKPNFLRKVLATDRIIKATGVVAWGMMIAGGIAIMYSQGESLQPIYDWLERNGLQLQEMRYGTAEIDI